MLTPNFKKKNLSYYIVAKFYFKLLVPSFIIPELFHIYVC